MAQALETYEAGIGPCGFHHSLTSDLANHFTSKTSRCNVCAAQALAARVQAEQDQKAMRRYGETPPGGIPRPWDGRLTQWVMMHPLEVAAKSNRAG